MRNSNRKRKEKATTIKINTKKVITISIIFFSILLFSTIFALINSLNTKIINRVQINGVQVSKLEINEAYAKLQEELKKQTDKNINLKYGEYETAISLKQIDVGYDTIEAVNTAYKIGRDKNIIKSNYQTILTYILGKKIIPEIQINENELNKTIDDIATKIPGTVKQSSYSIEGESLIIIPGVTGIELDKENLKNTLIDAINKQIKGIEIGTIELQVTTKEPDPIDIEKIQKEIYKESQNAYYDKAKSELHAHVNGVDFEISIEEAKQIIQEEKEEYIIPLKITIPEITTDEVTTNSFVDELSKYTTRYDESNINRTNNIKIASEKVNGTIVMPGETFSYNQTVGARTIKAGYKEAAVYVNGKVVDGIGGGICQVSSTLYNAVLNANLEIISRRNHYFITSYVPASQDATVSYGTIDFKFKNTRNYPIKIECTAKNGISQVTIRGLKEETEYEVVIKSEITEVIPYTTKYIDTNTLEKGKENIVQKGTNGYKSEAYKILKLNGKVVSKTLLSKDSYNPMQRIIERGTK